MRYLALVLLTTAAAVCFLSCSDTHDDKTATVTTPELPPGLSPEEEQAYRDRETWLNEKLVEWKPEECEPMHFMGFHVLLSSTHHRDRVDLEVHMQFLDMLIETGVDIISVGINGSPTDLDDSLIAGYDTVFSRVREKELKLKIWLRTFVYPPDLRPQKALEGAEYIIERWHPEYYVIMHEPESGDVEAMQRLKQYVEDCCILAKSLDPNVITSVTGLNWAGRLDCIDYFVEIPELDFVGFDIYGTWGLGEDCRGGNAIEEKINLIHSEGKESWIEEAWCTGSQNKQTPDPYDSYPGFWHPNRAWWDSQFLRVMTYYAQKNNLIGLEPWFTNNFVLYPGYEAKGDEEYKEQYYEDLINALAEGKRTPTFYEFKKLIEEFGIDK